MRNLTILLAAIVLAAVTQSTGAAPLVPAQVDAKAQWYGHVDFEAIHALPLVQEWIDKTTSDPRHKEHIEEMTQKLGMNPMQDLLGVTLYATQYEGDFGVVIFHVRKADQAKLTAELKAKHADVKTADYNGHTLHTWTENGHGKSMEIAGAFVKDNLIVVGADASHVKAAIDVIDGKRPGLTADSELLKGQTQDVLFSSRAIAVPAEYRKTTRCPILRATQAAQALWTNKDGQITGQYGFTADTPEQAANFKLIADGFKALGSMRYGDLPEVKKVIDALTYKIDGSSFTVAWTATAQDVKAATEAMHKRDGDRHRKPAEAPEKSEK